MAINPLLQNLIDNTKPVQTTKYKANSSEDYKAQSVSSNFQIYGNSPMKPAPIKFTPMPLKKPTVEWMINDFNKNIPIQPMSWQGTIAPAPAPSMTQPLPGIQQLPSEVKTSWQEFAEGFSANLQNRQANDFVPVTKQTVLDLSANIAQWDTIEAIKSKFPELQHLDDQVIKDFSANLAQWDNYETLVQKYPELNPDIANNPDQRWFSLKQEWKNFLNYASAFWDTVSQLWTKAIDEWIMQKWTYGKIVSWDIEWALESTVPNTLWWFAKFVIQTPAFITTIAEDPEWTVAAMWEQWKELVKMAVEDPRWTAKKLLEYWLDNPVDIIFALQWAKSLLKQWEKIAQQWQKLYNTAKVIAENQEVPVKFNRVNPGAITTPEMAQKFSQPVKETVRTTMPAREVIKVKAKQWFENLKRKAQEVLPKKWVQETVIDAWATDYSTKAQEVVQKAKDVFKKKPTAEVVTDTPETTGKSTLDKVQPSKKDVVQWERKGIDPIVVAVVKEKPGLFKQVQNGEITEETVADKIIQAKEQKFSESSQIGKTYESMYQSEYKFDWNTILDQSVEKLKSLWISLEDWVKIDSTKYVAESWEKGKIWEALSKIFDIQWKEISVQELHTLRKSVDKLIKRSEWIDRKNSKAVLELRSIIDNELKDKIWWWKWLDEMSSQKYDEIWQIMSEFFDRKWKFKYDPKTLLTDRNKKKLDILEELIPWVKDEIIMLATHKSYLRSKNTNKPGTYRKSMIKQVASTLWWIAWVTAWNSTVWSILMWMAGTYVWEKVGAYFWDPESFIKSITKDNRGASIIDDIEIWQDISQADKEYLNSLVKEAIKSWKIQKTERIMKKNKEEAIKKEVKRWLDTLIRKKSMSLPEKTETNLWTKRNPIRAYDKRPKEEIKAQENKKQDFQKNYKVASLDNFTIDRAKRWELYFWDGTKVSTIKNKPAYPYNPIQAILEDGRIIDLMKQWNDLFVKKTVWLDNLKPKEKQIQTVIETPEKEWLMPRDEWYQSTVKEWVNTINLSEMTDDEFMNYQEKLDVDNISPDIEKAILDEIFRRSNTSIDPQEKFIKDMMQEISIIDWMEQRVGTVWRNKVTDKKYTETQQKAVDKRRERAIETIQEELWIDQNEAYDKYLELQNKYKYQQVIRDRSTVAPSEALATIRKYFDADELSVNFLDNIVTPSWQEAFGRYYNKTIDMIKNPHKTTADHESAHAYFDMFTSKEDQSKILGQIKKEQWFTDDLEAEEFLADWFADYVSGKAKMTYGQKIKEFFKNVWEQIKKLFWKEDQVKQFYNDIMNKRRKTLGKKTQLKFKDTKFETYWEADKYTIQPIIDIRKEIKADIIKKDTLQKMINRQSYRWPERKALEEIVSNMKWDTIPKEEVINWLKASIMPLNASYTTRYADYNKLYTIESYSPEATKHTASTIILETPFRTDVKNHFDNPNYFSHVRVSNEKRDYENRVLMELQSDLMQHEEKYSDTDVRKIFSNDDILKAVKDLIPQSKIDEFFNIAMDSAEMNPWEWRIFCNRWRNKQVYGSCRITYRTRIF